MKNKKKRLNKSDMYPMVELYLESKLSQVEFCSEMNIKGHTFNYWLVKYRKDHRGSESNFLDVKVLEHKEVVSSPTNIMRTIRIHCADGMLIEIPA